MLSAIRAGSPAAEIVAIVLRAAPRLLLSGVPNIVDRVVYLPYWEKGSLAFARHALGLPFLGRFDACFLAYPAARIEYLLLLLLVRARLHVAHAYPAARIIHSIARTLRIVPIIAKHNVERNDDLIALAAGAGCFEAPPVRSGGYVVPTSWQDTRRDARRIVLHVGSIAHDGFDLKRWPEASFADLARRLMARGFDVTLVRGPDEFEATERVRAAAPGATILSGTLPEIAAALSRARAVVANDNGIAHLAAAVRTPVVALFGPTPIEHRPYGRDVVALRPSPCPPCFSPLLTGISCELNIEFRCLKDDLPITLVERAVIDLVGDEAGTPVLPVGS